MLIKAVGSIDLVPAGKERSLGQEGLVRSYHGCGLRVFTERREPVVVAGLGLDFGVGPQSLYLVNGESKRCAQAGSLVGYICTSDKLRKVFSCASYDWQDFRSHICIRI